MKIFTNLTFLHLISHQLLWLPEKNWFQWYFLKKIWYQKFTSFFQNFHQIPIFECSGPPQTWKNPRKWLKNSFSSGHRFYLGCCKIWANSIELAFLADDPVSLDLAYCALGGSRIKLDEPQSQLGGPQSQLDGPQSQLKGPQNQLGGSQSQLRGPGGDRRTDGRTDGISPHSTGLRPLSGPLPCFSFM